MQTKNDLIPRHTAIVVLETLKEIVESSDPANVFVSDITDALDVIRNVKAVDAEPVRHSKWLQHRVSVPKGKGQTYLVYGCWICHKHERKRTPYCPNCGAKMDAEAER